MSTTVNNNDASSSTSASKNAEPYDLRMKSMEDQINNLSLDFTRFMKEPMFSSNTNSRSQRTHDDSDTESEQSDDESSNNVDVPTDYQLSDTLLGQYKHMVNNQGLLVQEEFILKKDEISELERLYIVHLLHGKTRYHLHLLVDPQYRDLFRFVWKGLYYRWKTMPFGLSTSPRIFTMLLRPVLRVIVPRSIITAITINHWKNPLIVNELLFYHTKVNILSAFKHHLAQ
ncbi:hypothetical protein ACTFIR_003852 [Dictyostelium discoideum]